MKKGSFVKPSPYLPISWMLSWKTRETCIEKEADLGGGEVLRKQKVVRRQLGSGLLCWELGRSKKKKKKKSMCKVSDSTEMSSSTQYCFLCSTIQTGIYGFQSPTPTCLRITKMCVKPHIAHTATCAFISTVFKQPWERDILLTFKQWSQCLNLTNWYPLLPRWWWNLLPSHSSYDQAFPHTALKRYSGCSRSRVYPTAA